MPLSDKEFDKVLSGLDSDDEFSHGVQSMIIVYHGDPIETYTETVGDEFRPVEGVFNTIGEVAEQVNRWGNTHVWLKLERSDDDDEYQILKDENGWKLDILPGFDHPEIVDEYIKALNVTA